MKLQDFIKLLESKLCSNIIFPTTDFEVEIELNHSESPDVIKVKLDYKEKIITIIKGNCGL